MENTTWELPHKNRRNNHLIHWRKTDENKKNRPLQM